MDIFAKRLCERAKQLGISNAEAARRVGLEERRYAHYASSRREPDLATLTNIAKILNTTPNWLLGVEDQLEEQPNKTALIERFVNTARVMSLEELEICIIQAEAIVASKNTKISGK
ncbi:MAG: transcriptional regulator [Hyphomicrobiales bacterium]|nr:MAG: transcriptional regulator [Hyphomicrobiales bacterium]